MKIHEGQTVTRVMCDGYGVTGVRVDNEERKASWVVVAAGSRSGEMEGVSLPVCPLKGQALALEASAIAPLTISRILDSTAGYIVPCRDGRWLIGATVEDVGFDKQVTVDATQKLLVGAIRLVPALKGATVRESWAGLRPCSADGLPIIGRA